MNRRSLPAARPARVLRTSASLPAARPARVLRTSARLVRATALVALLLAACSYESPNPYRPPGLYPEPDAVAIDTGRYLYARDCGFCHGNDGGGTPRGPGLRDSPNGPALTHFMLTTGRMPIDSPDVPSRHRDPAYGEDEIAAIVAYVDQAFRQVGPEVPVVTLDDAELPHGQQLYQESCAACHATTGIGGAMLATRGNRGPLESGVHIPGLEVSTPVEVAEAVRTGPGTMPVFSTSTLSEEELDAIVTYVGYLRDPRDAGGAPIGHVGPVVEGAVGWAVGLGILLIIVRWMGTKAGETK